MVVGCITKTQPDGSKRVYISGDNGAYRTKVKNSSVRYGRNAICNFMRYMKYSPATVAHADYTEFNRVSEEIKKSGVLGKGADKEKIMALADRLDEALQDVFETENSASEAIDKSMPHTSFAMKYMPGNLRYTRVNTMALLGASFEELGKRVSVATEELTAKLRTAFGNFKGSEKLSAEVLDINSDGQVDISEYATSILASDMLSGKGMKLENINGIITDEGQLASLKLFTEEEKPFADRTFTTLHSLFGLSSAKDRFLADTNNLIK